MLAAAAEVRSQALAAAAVARVGATCEGEQDHDSADRETAAAERQAEQCAAAEAAAQAEQAAHAQTLADEHQAAQAEQAAAASSVAAAAGLPLAVREADGLISASNTAAGHTSMSSAEQVDASCAMTRVGSEYGGPDSGGEAQPVGPTQVLIELGSSDSDEEAVAVPVASQELQDASDLGQEDAADREQCSAIMFPGRCLRRVLGLQGQARGGADVAVLAAGETGAQWVQDLTHWFARVTCPASVICQGKRGR